MYYIGIAHTVYYKMRCWTRETNDLTELLPRNTRASSMFVKWKYLPTFCIALFSFFSTCKMCFISLWEHKWALEHLNHQEVNFLSQALTSDCVHVENFCLQNFCRWGRTKPPSFWICELLLVLQQFTLAFSTSQWCSPPSESAVWNYYFLHNEISKSASWKQLLTF